MVAWRARKFVLRVGAGSFFERSGPGPIWDVLRYDGVRLRRYLLSGNEPSAATSIHRLAASTELPNLMQFSAGFERQLSKKSTLAVSYVGVRATQQLRSRDGNAPLPPSFESRPDPGVNVLRLIESTGRLEGDLLEITARGELAPRITGTAQYVFGKTMTDTAGVNWFPANSFAPAGEWGRADTDRRHQFNFLGTATLHRWANFGLSVSLLSGIPFNITTGGDDNREGRHRSACRCHAQHRQRRRLHRRRPALVPRVPLAAVAEGQESDGDNCRGRLQRLQPGELPEFCWRSHLALLWPPRVDAALAAASGIAAGAVLIRERFPLPRPSRSGNYHVLSNFDNSACLT